MSYRFRLAPIPESLANDTRGAVISTEIIVLSAIILIGLIVAISATRDSIISELSDVAGSVQDSNQSLNYNGITTASASVAGSDFFDAADVVDSADDPSGQADNCISFDLAPANEDIVSRFAFVANFEFNADLSDSAPFGSGNSATLVADAFVGKDSLHLDGTDDFLAIDDSDDFGTKPVEERSIHLDFSTNDTISNQVLYEEGDENTGIAVYLSNGNLFTTFYDNIGAPNEYKKTFSSPVNSGESNKVTLVYNSNFESSGFAVSYLNGASFGRTSEAPTLQAYPNSGTGLGGKNLQSYFSNLSENYGEFDGKIGTLKVFERELSLFEINALARQ